jgi:hypothetical protein
VDKEIQAGGYFVQKDKGGNGNLGERGCAVGRHWTDRMVFDDERARGGVEKKLMRRSPLYTALED